jgi:hypothetical protein
VVPLSESSDPSELASDPVDPVDPSEPVPGIEVEPSTEPEVDPLVVVVSSEGVSSSPHATEARTSATTSGARIQARGRIIVLDPTMRGSSRRWPFGECDEERA